MTLERVKRKQKKRFLHRCWRCGGFRWKSKRIMSPCPSCGRMSKGKLPSALKGPKRY